MSRTLAAVRRAARPVAVAATALAALTASTLAYADGIDISHWQGSVTWSKVKSDGVTFAFMKATEGDYYTDPTLRTNWSGAERQGIYRGAYHFARPSIGSADRQARYFVSKVGPLHDKGDLPPVLDLEATGGLSPSSLRTWVRNWLETTERLTGRTPILYFSPSFWESNMGNSTTFTHYPLWIAHYTTGSPRVPGGWNTWTFWQRTSSGSVDGISGHVDMNRFNGSSAALARIANSSGGSSAPPPSGPTLPVGAATSLTMTPGTTAAAEIMQSVPFTGELRTTSPVAAVVDREVTLWSRRVGSTTWNQVGTDRTDATGRWSTSVAVPRTADYQARWVGGSRYAASASPVVRVTTPARLPVSLDLHKDATTVRKGAPLMLYGHATSGDAGVAGLTVRYYKRMPDGGSWIYVGRSTSKAPTGWHSIVVHPQITRVWKAVTSGSTTYGRARSSYLTVRPQ